MQHHALYGGLISLSFMQNFCHFHHLLVIRELTKIDVLAPDMLANVNLSNAFADLCFELVHFEPQVGSTLDWKITFFPYICLLSR